MCIADESSDMEDNGEHLKNEGNIFRPIGLAGGMTKEFAPRLVRGSTGPTRTYVSVARVGAG